MGWVGWVESWWWGVAKPPLGHFWSSHDANRHPQSHTMAHATLVGHRDVQSAVGTILGLHRLISALHWSHCSNHDFGELAKCPSESGPINILTFNSLRMDRYLSVSVGWGNKIIFSCKAN